MSNALSVVVTGNITTIWAPQPMEVVTPFMAMLLQKSLANEVHDVSCQEELQLLLAAYRQDPSEKNKKDLLWHITCFM